MRTSTKIPLHVSERDRGLIDTSVYIDLAKIPTSALPASISISAITLAELAAGPHAAVTADERARRQVRLQDAEADFTAIPFGHRRSSRVRPRLQR